MKCWIEYEGKTINLVKFPENFKDGRWRRLNNIEYNELIVTKGRLTDIRFYIDSADVKDFMDIVESADGVKIPKLILHVATDDYLMVCEYRFFNWFCQQISENEILGKCDWIIATIYDDDEYARIYTENLLEDEYQKVSAEYDELQKKVIELGVRKAELSATMNLNSVKSGLKEGKIYYVCVDDRKFQLLRIKNGFLEPDQDFNVVTVLPYTPKVNVVVKTDEGVKEYAVLYTAIVSEFDEFFGL